MSHCLDEEDWDIEPQDYDSDACQRAYLLLFILIITLILSAEHLLGKL